jgi:adenosylhomocysteine nucleosidase
MSYCILLVALEAELPYKRAPGDCKVVYTGVGKLNAAFAAQKAINEAHNLGFHPKVINYGTAGSCTPSLSGLQRVTRFVQRDMNAEPLVMRSVTPFEAGLRFIDCGHDMTPGLTIGTGDSFVHEIDPWLVDNHIDIVDMEAYAIASVCKKMNVNFNCYKYITDYIGTPHQSEVWQKHVADGVDNILEVLN